MLYYKLRNTPYQIARGCTDLPHVGVHPGTSFVVCMVLITGFAGFKNGGALGFLIASIGAAIAFGSFYAIGAWSRAELSDRISRRTEIENLLQAWVNVSSFSGDLPVRYAFNITGSGKDMRVHTQLANELYGPDIPQWINDAVDEIMTERRGDKPARLPDDDELRIMSLKKTDLSAHGQLAAHNMLSRHARRPYSRGLHPRVKALA
jgi:hypothetical protein